MSLPIPENFTGTEIAGCRYLCRYKFTVSIIVIGNSKGIGQKKFPNYILGGLRRLWR